MKKPKLSQTWNTCNRVTQSLAECNRMNTGRSLLKMLRTSVMVQRYKSQPGIQTGTCVLLEQEINDVRSDDVSYK